MGRQERKYWIAEPGPDMIPSMPTARRRASHPDSPTPLTAHFRTPTRPHGQRQSPRSESARFAAYLTLAIAWSRANGRPWHALVTVSLVGFPQLHAQVGTEAADRVLDAARRTVQGCLGTADEMARVGTSEFNALIDCRGDAAAAWRVAELLRHQLAAPIAIGERLLGVSAEVGVALVQPHHVTAADVRSDAHAGTVRELVEDDAVGGDASRGSTRANEYVRLAAELRRAIDRGEFRMHYQPIHDCADGTLRSLEALIRWEHPVRGRLLPAEFLDAVSQAGLMPEVGYWVIEEVCRQSVEWRDGGARGVPIAINVSPRQLLDRHFVTRLDEIVRRTGAWAAAVAFEVTEDFECGDCELAQQSLRILRDAGFAVRLDDFGTGFSSLSHLQHLPVSGLKIDRSFTHALDRDGRQRAIVAAIIQLAHGLGLDVIAEGVEREDQLAALLALGCDSVQGYLLGAPAGAAEAVRWLMEVP